MKYLAATVCVAFLLGAGAASAETKDKAAPKARSAKSLECSKEADTKNLHGKPRKVFMRTCKKA